MSDLLIKLLSTDAVIMIIIGIFVTYITKWLASKDSEAFKKYEGYAITAIKAAEKAIPDDIPNKGLNRLDFALKTFVSKYEMATGLTTKPVEVAKIEAWISAVHSELEGAGILSK